MDRSRRASDNGLNDGSLTGAMMQAEQSVDVISLLSKRESLFAGGLSLSSPEIAGTDDNAPGWVY